MIVGSDRYGCVCVLSFRQLLQALSLLGSRLTGKVFTLLYADLRTYPPNFRFAFLLASTR